MTTENLWQRTLHFLLVSSVFALAYTQSPLYTSNQNQYFLHGLAKAGFGFLSNDWLANTADPTPVFSLMVEWIYSLTRLEGLYYVIYAILMGVYLFSLIGISGTIFNIRSNKYSYLFFLTGLVVVHSAGMRFFISRLIGINWAYLFEDGVADQRLLGPVFQPSTFGILLLLAIYLFLSKKIIWAGISAVIASVFHPTYVLSSAFLVIAFMILTYQEKGKIQLPVIIGLVSAVLISPIIFYIFVKIGNSPAGVISAAQHILVEYRIPHHAKVSWWFDYTAATKIILILLALYLTRKKPIFTLMILGISMSAFLTLIQLMTNSDMLALLFPWRMSAWLVPLSTAIILSWLASRFEGWILANANQFRVIVTLVCISLLALAFVTGITRIVLDFTRQTELSERAALTWIYKNKEAGDLYLIPIKMQDFRLATGAPAFVDFKSIPYRGDDVLEWYRRIQMSEEFYKSNRCILWDIFIEKEEITHFVINSDMMNPSCQGFYEVYRDPHFRIYSH